MALIKGSQFYPSDKEPEDSKKSQSREESHRKGGLIKGKSYKTNFLSDSPIPQGRSKKRNPVKRGKILKAKWTSLLKPEEMSKETIEKGAQKSDLSDSGFLPASFVAREGKKKGDSSPRDVVMIPSRKPLAKEPEHEAGEETPEDQEFKVEEPAPAPQVDVEAIIAEAEQKGREKATKIIEHAQAEAKKLIEQAKIYGETAKTEAHREGFKLGKEDGYKAGLEEFTALMEEAKNLFTQLVNERRKLLESVEPELANLSISIAEKIIGAEVETNPDVVINIVKQAMEKMKSREEVTIKVHPDDLEHVQANRNVFAAMVEGIKDLDIIGDPRVDRGSCLIETNLGNTDARIKTQLGAIELAFKNAEGQ